MNETIDLLKNSDLPEPIHNVDPETCVLITSNMKAVEIVVPRAEQKKNPHLRRFCILDSSHIMHKLDHKLSGVSTTIRQKIYMFLISNKYITIKRFSTTINVSMVGTKDILLILLEMDVIQQYGTYYKRQDEWYDHIHCFIDPSRTLTNDEDHDVS